MYQKLLLNHLQNEIVGTYFELCHYFLNCRRYQNDDDLARLNFYQTLLLESRPSLCQIRQKLDLEFLATTASTRQELVHTYSAEFLTQIVHSGIQEFFDKMERYALVDVYLRTRPALYHFFLQLTPIVKTELMAKTQEMFERAKESLPEEQLYLLSACL